MYLKDKDIVCTVLNKLRTDIFEINQFKHYLCRFYVFSHYCLNHFAMIFMS